MSYPSYMEWERTAVIGTTLVEVISIELPIFVDKMSIEVSNGGSDALNDFEIRKKATRSATWRPIYNTATDWTTPTADSHIKYAEGSPTNAYQRATTYLGSYRANTRL